MGTGNGNGSIAYDWPAIDTAFSDRDARTDAYLLKERLPKTDIDYYVKFVNQIRKYK